MADNMRFYNAARKVPHEAQKTIQAGRLKGMTDVNPMYRIKRLTEIFGPCGLGWWYIIKDERIIDDEITGQRAAFVDIDLFYKDPGSGEVSHAIPGTGGAAFVSKERSGPYLSDECFKMALTDAISVAAKAIGVAADVYWEKDRTKYSGGESAAGAPSPAAAPSPGVSFKRGDDRVGATPTTGTHEAAQAAGKAKLKRLDAQVEAAVQATGAATDAQKKYIIDHATDGDYMQIMQKYGANLERLSTRGAEKVIAQIVANNAAGESA
jgi:hypothetical protein